MHRLAFMLMVPAMASACAADKPGPATVVAADANTDSPSTADTGAPPTATAVASDAAAEATPSDTTPPAGIDNPSGVWVEDQDGVRLGLLVRRGSDDSTASRSIYDIVTVFHPASGLFFEVTMSDGLIRYPVNTYFSGFNCVEPVGVAVGACTDCKSAYGLAFVHGDRWYQVEGGQTWQTMGAEATMKGGMSSECVAHSTTSAKGYPIRRVENAVPPSDFTPPLRFVAH
jgi:hypothetical protein